MSKLFDFCKSFVITLAALPLILVVSIGCILEKDNNYDTSDSYGW